MTRDDLITTSVVVEGEPPLGRPAVLSDHEASLRRNGPSLVPDFVGLEALDAHALARSSHLRLSVSVWETTVGPWGLVLDQRTDPGARVRRGTRIEIIVSGRPHAPVPDIRGLSLDSAIEQLSWLGLVPLACARRSSSSIPVGHVISTRPVAGTLLAHGSVVALSVAR